ncbi:MAG: FkbM family methyltransferase [Gaiellaceae bacterium]
MIPDLIYDVGFHNGIDTEHYLSKGYRVVAVEANPELVEAGKKRFAAEIDDGRLTLLGACIAAQTETTRFWVNDYQSEWSAFDRDLASRDGTTSHPVDVPGVTFDSILAEHGVPHYLKIDIEQSDLLCLQALQREDLPAYVSVEAHSLLYLAILASLGYDSFKCVDQMQHQPANVRLRRFESFIARHRLIRTVSGPFAPTYRRITTRYRESASEEAEAHV